MKQWLLRLIAIVALALLGLWIWHTFFPNPEKVIRNRLTEVARLASFDSNESDFAHMANAMSLVSYFTTDTECIFSSPDIGEFTASGRDDLRGKALYLRSLLTAMRVEFLDTAVKLAPDQQTATVNLTVRASRPGDKDFVVKEMKFTLRNTNGNWLIARAETVKTLS